MVKRIAFVGFLIVGILLVSLGVAGAQDAQLKFIMIAHGSPAGNPFWSTVEKGMVDACALLSADCTWLGDPSYSAEAMAAYWEDALAAQPTGIGTTAPDAEVVRSGVETARSQGIPVIIFNTADKNAGTDKALQVLFYVGANEFTGGVSNARRVFAAAEAAGTPINRGVCTIQEQGHSGLEARCAGVRSVFDEMGVQLDILDIVNDPTESAGKISEYFTANPDTNAIFMLGPNPSAALNLYLNESGRTDLFATTHDTSEEIFDMIEQGRLLQAIDQQPYLQGFETIMWLFLNRPYKLQPGGDICTGPGVIDQSNLEAIRALVAGGYR
ncbi:MAG: substrate-binding domain-containing protein [Anaerolineae bacterium]|nr:substrate-binding domain-containing protein [Anaerolineae bacterium]